MPGGSQEGVTFTRFRDTRGKVVADEQPSRILKLSSGQFGLIGDHSGSPVSGELGAPIKRLGLNVPEVMEVVRNLALPRLPTGAALLRWGDADPLLRNRFGRTATIWAFLRQKLLLDQSGGANELGTELHLYVTSESQANPKPFDDLERLAFLRSLYKFSTRNKPTHDLADTSPESTQGKLLVELTRPSETELANQIRNAVWPLLLAHIEP